MALRNLWAVLSVMCLKLKKAVNGCASGKGSFGYLSSLAPTVTHRQAVKTDGWVDGYLHHPPLMLSTKNNRGTRKKNTECRKQTPLRFLGLMDKFLVLLLQKCSNLTSVNLG